MLTIERDPQVNQKFLASYYPGRIVIVSLSEDGEFWRLITGMGGRSAPSKNRFYQIYTDMNGHGEIIKTEPHNIELHKKLFSDPSVKIDPAAILYTAHRQKLVLGNTWHVASNGEQTDGIASIMAIGGIPGTDRFMQGQKHYKNEGEKNDYTARITIALNTQVGRAYLGKIERKPDNFEESNYMMATVSEKDFVDEDMNLPIRPGEGYMMATYDGVGGVEPDPITVRKLVLPGSFEDVMENVWSNWSSSPPPEGKTDTRAGLAGKEIEKGSGRFRYLIKSAFVNPGHPEDDPLPRAA